jgi:hypothetical protein
MRFDSQLLKSNTLLHTGFSAGEGLYVFALIGILAGLAISASSGVAARLTALEPLVLSGGLRTDTVVFWAESGEFPNDPGSSLEGMPALTPDLVDSRGQLPWKRIEQDAVTVTNGVFGFSIRESPDGTGGQSIFIRPAFSAGRAPTTLLWVCGHAPPPPGFHVVGEDKTTIKNQDLASPCRAPMSKD